MENPINEKELITKGKEMIADGLGAAFVYNWVKDRVEDEELRGRILQIINSNSDTIAPPKTEDKIIEERKLRTTRYVYEDFQEAISKIKTSGIIYIILGFLLLISVYFWGALSLKHALLSCILGAAIYFVQPKIDWEQSSNLMFWAGGIVLVVILEFLILGLPNRFIPNLGETERVKVIHVITIINDFTPILYFCIKISLPYPFLKALFQKSKLDKEPADTRRKLGIKVK